MLSCFPMFFHQDIQDFNEFKWQNLVEILRCRRLRKPWFPDVSGISRVPNVDDFWEGWTWWCRFWIHVFKEYRGLHFVGEPSFPLKWSKSFFSCSKNNKEVWVILRGTSFTSESHSHIHLRRSPHPKLSFLGTDEIWDLGIPRNKFGIVFEDYPEGFGSFIFGFCEWLWMMWMCTNELMTRDWRCSQATGFFSSMFFTRKMGRMEVRATGPPVFEAVIWMMVGNHCGSIVYS